MIAKGGGMRSVAKPPLHGNKKWEILINSHMLLFL